MPPAKGGGMEIIMKPLVSVIVAIYKVEDSLTRCIESLLKQSIKDIEIILINDASPDHCGDICELYAEKDTRIKVFYHKTNQGLSEARNTGIKMASSDYLMFVDGDDVVHSDFCRVPYECAIQNKADLVMFKYKTVHFVFWAKIFDNYFSSTACNHITKIEALDLLQGSVGHFAWNKLYKKVLFDDNLYPSGYFYEDWGTTYKTVLKARKIVYIEKYLYFYYQRPNSISSIKSEKALKDSHALKMQQYYDLSDWGYPADKLDTFLQNVALSYCIKKKRDWLNRDYVFCAEVLKNCYHTPPEGFNKKRKLLFLLFRYCPAIFDVLCFLWGKKCY